MLARVALVFPLVALLACPPSSTPDPTIPTPGARYADHIDDYATFARLAARPATSSTARTEVVKFTIDLAYERRLYFFDTNEWEIHYTFARDHLATREHPVEAHGLFNVQQYRRPERRFLLGSLVHYMDSDIWTVELIAGDNLEAERVVSMFEQVRNATYLGDRLRYRPLSPLHETIIAGARDRLPLVTADEVFAGVNYQPLTLGTAYGYLRVFRGPVDSELVGPNQIIVLTEIPDEIPLSAGVITMQLQAPLGHIAILCSNRQTPNMGLRNALDAPSIQELEGRLVKLEVGAQEFRVSAASREEAEEAWNDRRPREPQIPRLSEHPLELRSLCDLRSSDATTAGAKASQLGEVCSLGSEMNVPPGFVIPMRGYVDHVAPLASTISALLDDPQVHEGGAARDARLAALRDAIVARPVSPALLDAVAERVARMSSPRIILRSSTNAEDLPGFTGAGLYRSVRIARDASRTELERAIREVWSSLWLRGAFDEREWYRIDHRNVAMAILVQEFVDGAIANGVAITGNPFYEHRPGLFINAQALGGSVTGAAGDEIPEQHLIYTYAEELEIETLSRSSRTGGEPLLRESEIIHFGEILQHLHNHFHLSWGNRANSLDVEFLIAGEDRHLVILQARPYRIVWDTGRGS